VTALLLLVPRQGTKAEAVIDAHSGIVGSPRGELVTVDFEGNRYHAANLTTYADRVRAAADRHLARYPTVARGVFAAEAFTIVGSFDPATSTLAIADEHALRVWLGLEDA
jgi:hypothetical protein